MLALPAQDFDMASACPALRACLEADMAAMHAVYASTREEEVACLPWSQAQKSDFLRMQSRAQQVHYARHYAGASFDCIVLGTEVIGRLYVHHGLREVRLVDISLLPGFRGRGIGTGLLKQLIDEVAQAGLVLSLHVANDNAAARRWYRRLGFQDVAHAGLSTMMTLQAGASPAVAAAAIADATH